MRTSVKRALVISTAVAVTVGAGAAYAAWTVSGSGNAVAKAATAQPVSTVDASASVSGDLYPGATGSVALTVKNPNAFPIKISAITGNGAITASGGSGTCTTTGVTFTDQTGLTLSVDAKGQSTVILDGAAAMSQASDDGCQGATFTIPVRITAVSGS